MKYCARCLYPENARPTIIFDDEGVCSGCRYHESRMKLEIDWEERLQMFEQILEEAKNLARKRGNSHDCIVPISGGKDSHYQVWLLKKKYGMNPLLVTFNHAFNTPAGNRNLYNLVEKSGCDFVRYTAGLESVRRISRYMLETVGDLTWHYHAGIRTYPFQVAVERNIPLIVWGEHGFAELTGIVSLEDFVEFTRWTRKEHDMRGYEPHDLVGKGGITEQDIAPYIYPSDEDIARVEVRGIYLSNFIYWNAKKQAEVMMEEWDFAPIAYERERTFNLHSKIEDHANDVHDYLKYLKFGYGRATDDASMEIRHGRMTREEGMELVKRYDSREPSTLETYCDFMGISKEQFYDWVAPMRDQTLWKKNENGGWVANDAVFNHAITEREEKSRGPQVQERTFSEENRNLYYNPDNPPEKSGEQALDVPSKTFRVI
ncbi:N-acetyl sugar amidotransferase [Methylophilus aquaticus]|uniref:N-acetyl sugar amidotransferase n=1 Tax=Methylophilus aquaticus TaxID=1971610 RepID=A0ABT9JU18_9PROT|nr:N-acetyl sugar amidotransferase [Methylophilus aquaticus]MDP8568081.1 N-acetyl sugar amidotransferase [Methylophilus aquaticus]